MRVVHHMAESLQARRRAGRVPRGHDQRRRRAAAVPRQPDPGRHRRARAGAAGGAAASSTPRRGAASLAPCYIGDDTLVGSLWRTLTGPPITAVVTFGEPQHGAGPRPADLGGGPPGRRAGPAARLSQATSAAQPARGTALERHHVVHLGADADPLADLVVVVAGHVGQHRLAAAPAAACRETPSRGTPCARSAPSPAPRRRGRCRRRAAARRIRRRGRRRAAGIRRRRSARPAAVCTTTWSSTSRSVRRREHAVADEVGDEARGRAVVQRVRVVPLVQPALVHHADRVADGEGLQLVVRDEQRRRAAPPSGCRGSRAPGARAGPRRGWRTARPAAAAAAAAPAPAPAPRAAAARPTARAACAARCRPGRPVPAPRPRGAARSAARQLRRGRSPRCGPRPGAGTARSPGTPCRCGGSPPARARPALPTTSPEIRISPALARSRPATARSSVVLPQPEGPISTPMSPAGRPNETSSTAGRARPA